MYSLSQFLQDENLKAVDSASTEDRALLLWASLKKYISLTRAPKGELCYSDHDIECARMWAEKVGVDEEGGE